MQAVAKRMVAGRSLANLVRASAEASASAERAAFDQSPRPAGIALAAAAAKAADQASLRCPGIAPGLNIRRTDPSGGAIDSAGGFGRGAIIHRLVAVDLDHRMRRRLFHVLRHQADMIGRRALVAIAIDPRAITRVASSYSGCDEYVSILATISLTARSTIDFPSDSKS